MRYGFALLLIACAPAAPTTTAPTPCPSTSVVAIPTISPEPSLPTEVVDAKPPADVRIAEFDCSVDLDTKKGARLRSHDGPGPAGATWNWYGPLRCWIRTTGGCEKPDDDKVAFELGRLPTRRPTIKAIEGGWHMEVVIDQDTWIDEALRFKRIMQRYSSVPLVVRVGLDCADSLLVDSFVGRFAFGE